MEGQPREEYIGALRRRSSGFSRGVSKYRGVARCQTKCRRHWQCFETVLVAELTRSQS